MGAYRDIFDQTLHGKEDSGGVFARGFDSTGDVTEPCKDAIRSMVEKCDSFEGVMMYSAIGGGTGSGLSSHLLEHFDVEYSRKSKFSFTIYPYAKMLATT